MAFDEGPLGTCELRGNREGGQIADVCASEKTFRRIRPRFAVPSGGYDSPAGNINRKIMVVSVLVGVSIPVLT